MKYLNDLRDLIFQQNVECGWWSDLKTGKLTERNKGELIALMHSEVSEAYQGAFIKDDHLPKYSNNLVEMADTVIRLLDYAGGFNYDLTMDESMASLVSKIALVIGNNESMVTIYCEINSCLSDLLEAERKNKPDSIKSFTIINAIAHCYYLGFKLSNRVSLLDEIIREKLVYNKNRADHKPENRIKEGGKVF